MVGWKFMKRDMYISSGIPNRNATISMDEDNISLYGTSMDILKNGDYQLSYDGTNLYTQKAGGGEQALKLWSRVVPAGTEIKGYFIGKARENKIVNKKENVEFQPWILDTTNKHYQPEHVLLTTYGDLLIMEWDTNPVNDRIYWSAYRSTLIDAGYVNNIFPDLHEDEIINPSLKVNGKPSPKLDSTYG